MTNPKSSITCLVIGERKNPPSFAAIGMEDPNRPLVGEDAVKAFDELTRPGKTCIFCCAIRNEDGDLRPINARGTYTPNDVSLRWIPSGTVDPVTKERNSGRGEWRGLDDPAVWQFAPEWEKPKVGGMLYGKTFAARLDPIPQPGSGFIEVAVREFQEWRDEDGTVRWSWTFPSPVETVLEIREPDSISSVEKSAKFVKESVNLKEYSPDQSRDDSGKWAAIGGPSGGGSTGGGGDSGRGGDSGGGAGKEKSAIIAKQTDTKEFKEWFGDSKVVDVDGNPKVVYHGTNSDFDEFSPSNVGEFGPAHYFSDNAQDASEYATSRGKKDAARVLPVYLSVKNPITIPTGNPSSFFDRFPGETDRESIDKAISAGYDGIIYKRQAGQTHYIAFKSTQIKSATGNRGTFNPKSPKITESEIPKG